MKLCCLCLYFCLSIFSSSVIFPQDSISLKQDSILNTYEKKLFETEKKSKHVLYISFGSGYGKIVSDSKYNGLWIHEASFGIIFTNRWILGFKYEFWFSTYKGYVSPGIYTDVDFNGSGFNIIGGYKSGFLINKLAISVGLGFGKFIVDKGDYISIIVFSGISYFPANNISIDLNGSAKLISPGWFSPGGSGARGLFMPGIKIGATYYLLF